VRPLIDSFLLGKNNTNCFFFSAHNGEHQDGKRMFNLRQSYRIIGKSSKETSDNFWLVVLTILKNDGVRQWV
jgi:hypothetical protein